MSNQLYNEQYRLGTFVDWSSRTNKPAVSTDVDNDYYTHYVNDGSIISPATLAQHGFYYCPLSNRIKCCDCGLECVDFENSSYINEIHQRMKCVFANEKSSLHNCYYSSDDDDDDTDETVDDDDDSDNSNNDDDFLQRLRYARALSFSLYNERNDCSTLSTPTSAPCKTNSDIQKISHRRQQTVDAASTKINTTEICSICLNRQRDVCLIPCGHMVCSECAFRVETCPFCRSDIQRKQFVYTTV
nr:inhibitor of apoptosis protein 3 [Calliteara abietis nucleopolyhedrovirus]